MIMGTSQSSFSRSSASSMSHSNCELREADSRSTGGRGSREMLDITLALERVVCSSHGFQFRVPGGTTSNHALTNDTNKCLAEKDRFYHVVEDELASNATSESTRTNNDSPEVDYDHPAILSDVGRVGEGGHQPQHNNHKLTFSPTSSFRPSIPRRSLSSLDGCEPSCCSSSISTSNHHQRLRLPVRNNNHNSSSCGNQRSSSNPELNSVSNHDSHNHMRQYEPDNGDGVPAVDDYDQLKRLYDHRTWNMYFRIMEAREKKSLLSKLPMIGTDTATAATTFGGGASTVLGDGDNPFWMSNDPVTMDVPSSNGDDDEPMDDEHELIFGGIE